MMTEEQKQAECQRICGEAGKNGINSTVPELCPIQDEIWKGKRKK
jgi:hypothetical protein